MAKERLGVLGAGWVGLVTAACFADLGHEVVVRDVDPERIAELEHGVIRIHEPGLAELVERNRSRLTFTLDAAEAFEAARIVFVCVGTPSLYSGDADLSAVWRVLDELPDLGERTLLVMKSTVPVVVGAFVDADGDVVTALYEPLGAPLVRTDVASAEMIKLASNAFLATRISFINEIANVCEMTGADVVDVARGMALDHRLGTLLHAGVGYGGSCFPKDVSALKPVAGKSGYHFQLLTAGNEGNELQKRR